MSDTPFVIGINGSPHKDGIVCELLNAVLGASAAEGAETQTVHLYDLHIQHTPGLYSRDPALEIVANMPDDDMKDLYPALVRADAIVFATPTYWANMSGAMKDFIDRLTALENEAFALQHKIGVSIAASRQNEGGVANAAMSMLFAITQMGMVIPPNGVMWYPGDWHKANSTVEEFAKADAPNVGRNIVRLAQLFKEQNFAWDISEGEM